MELSCIKKPIMFLFVFFFFGRDWLQPIKVIPIFKSIQLDNYVVATPGLLVLHDKSNGGDKICHNLSIYIYILKAKLRANQIRFKLNFQFCATYSHFLHGC